MEEMLPSVFQLSQNYPNPFREKTTIKYCVPDKIKIKLEILNSDKRIIKTLVDEVKESGTYQAKFNASSLASGVYFYRLKAGDFVETKKMVLMK